VTRWGEDQARNTKYEASRRLSGHSITLALPLRRTCIHQGRWACGVGAIAATALAVLVNCRFDTGLSRRWPMMVEEPVRLQFPGEDS
jgi:hypothetical protein